MREFTQIENHQVEIWRRPYQRSLNLTVKPDGSIRVTCGKRISQRELLRFIDESRLFIHKRRLEIESMCARYPDKKYISGEPFLFFGERWQLEVIWSWGERVKVTPLEGKLEMVAPLKSDVDARQKAMRQFFRRQAKLHLHERAKFFAAKMSLFPSAISVRGQKTRWGSCSAEASIRLNWKLLAAPLAVIDYVVIHELAHIRHLNHSPEFWAVVAAVQPEWRVSRQWLREIWAGQKQP